MRKIENSDLEGKTIKSIQHDAVNVLILQFTDNTELELWTDTAVSTPYGNISGFFVEEN